MPRCYDREDSGAQGGWISGRFDIAATVHCRAGTFCGLFIPPPGEEATVRCTTRPATRRARSDWLCRTTWGPTEPCGGLLGRYGTAARPFTFALRPTQDTWSAWGSCNTTRPLRRAFPFVGAKFGPGVIFRPIQSPRGLGGVREPGKERVRGRRGRGAAR